MLVRGNSVIGLNVVTLDKGEKLEMVHDVVFDPKENKVKALVVDEGGWFSDAKVILIEDVESIGRDAVMVASDKVLKKASDVAQPVAAIAKGDQFLTKTRILTESGTDLGTVKDILFDPRTGNVEELEVTQGIRDIQSGKKTVRISNIITIGKDITIVKATTEQEFERQSQERGIQGAVASGIDTVKQRTPEFTENIKGQASQIRDQAADFSRQMQAKVKDIRESPQTQETIENARKQTLNALDEIRTSFERLVSRTQQKAEQVKESPKTQRTVEKIRDQADMARRQIEDKTKEITREVKTQPKTRPVKPVREEKVIVQAKRTTKTR